MQGPIYKSRAGFTKTFCNSLDILTDEAGVLRQTFQLFAGHVYAVSFSIAKSYMNIDTNHIKVVLGPFRICPKINLKKGDILKPMDLLESL